MQKLFQQERLKGFYVFQEASWEHFKITESYNYKSIHFHVIFCHITTKSLMQKVGIILEFLLNLFSIRSPSAHFLLLQTTDYSISHALSDTLKRPNDKHI